MQFTTCTRHQEVYPVLQPTYLVFGTRYCSYCAQHCIKKSISIKSIEPFTCGCICQDTKIHNVMNEAMLLEISKRSVPELYWSIGCWLSCIIDRFTQYPATSIVDIGN